MEDLSEGIFINMANLILARRDSYLDYLRAGIKQDTLTALRNSPLHEFIVLGSHEERHSTGSSQKNHGRYHPIHSLCQALESDWKSGVPAW